MQDFYPFNFSVKNWKTAAAFSAGVLALGLAGAAQAQSKNRTGESANATATAKGKADGNNKSNVGGKGNKAQKESPKRNSGENSANYHGAQPPQGGRLGQGRSEENR